MGQTRADSADPSPSQTEGRQRDVPRESGADAFEPLHDPDETIDEGIVEEVSNLIDDTITYAQAELAFQKTRAGLAGKAVGLALACVAVALILLHIAVLALAVGLVIALAPLVTIWGAIAIVVGALLLGTALLVWKAKGLAERLSILFGSDDAEHSA